MSRAAGGTYTLPGGNPVVTSTVISSTWANTTFSDVATALTDSLSRTGLGGMTAPLLGTDGTQALPAYSFTSEPSSGVYRIGAGSLGISVLNRLTLSIASTGTVTFAAPSAGATAIIGGIVDSVNMQFTAAGAQIAMRRSADNTQHFYLGGKVAASSDFSMWNDGGSGSEIQLTGSAVQFRNNAFTVWLSQSTSSGVLQFWEGTTNVGTAGLMQAASYETGSFTATLTGCTTAPTTTVQWMRCGPSVTLSIQAVISAVSNSTSVSLTGIPAALVPARTIRVCSTFVDAGTSFIAGTVQIAAAGTIMSGLTMLGGSTGFTNTATQKGFAPITFSYSLT